MSVRAVSRSAQQSEEVDFFYRTSARSEVDRSWGVVDRRPRRHNNRGLTLVVPGAHTAFAARVQAEDGSAGRPMAYPERDARSRVASCCATDPRRTP